MRVKLYSTEVIAFAMRSLMSIEIRGIKLYNDSFREFHHPFAIGIYSQMSCSYSYIDKMKLFVLLKRICHQLEQEQKRHPIIDINTDKDIISLIY